MKAFQLSKFIRNLMEPSVTEESLAARYATMSDAELRRIDPSELTSMARSIWEAEVGKRARPDRKKLGS